MGLNPLQVLCGPGHSERARVELRGIARNQAHMQLWLHRAIEPHELS
jgi:hypothetical protein